MFDVLIWIDQTQPNLMCNDVICYQKHIGLYIMIHEYIKRIDIGNKV